MTFRGLRFVASLVLAMLSSLAVSSAAVAAEYRLMVEPIYTPDRATEVYKPLVDHLNKTTGMRFILVAPRNYHFFWRDVRQNALVDFMLAEAHITDYRIKRFGAVPLVRTAEKTSYTLLASDQLDDPNLQRLVGRRIVTMPSPSLGFALLLELYPNPVSQPNILSSATSWRDGVEMVFADEADATMVPTWLKDQYPNLVPIATSREFSGTALSASAHVDETTRAAVREALLVLHEDPSLYEVLNELGISRFETASAADYAGHEAMLKGFFGYQ